MLRGVFVSFPPEKEMEEPLPLPLFQRRGTDPDTEVGGWGEQEGEGGVGGSNGNDDADYAKEKDAAWSFVSFPSEKKTKKPWPPPYLTLVDVMMDPDPE